MHFILLILIICELLVPTNSQQNNLTNKPHPKIHHRHKPSSPSHDDNIHNTADNDNTAFVLDDSHDYKYNLCVTSRLKNIHLLLPQWMEYHIIAGVDQFYFADDCSNDSGLTNYWSKFYQKEGYVTNIDVYRPDECNSSHVPDEFSLLNKLYHHSRPLCKWITQLDPDEYIFPNVDDEKCVGPHCHLVLENFLQHNNVPLHRFLLTIMSNEGYLKRPPGLIVDNYFHGSFFGIQLIKSIAQTKYFTDWKWPNYPEGKVCPPTDEVCTNFTVVYRNPRFNHNELSVYSTFADGKHVKCGHPNLFPFYIRHYQALDWEDHVELRVKRAKSASNTNNGWAGNANRTFLTWSSYNYNSTCPLGGEGYRKSLSKMVTASIMQRLRRYSHKEEVVLENYHRWEAGERMLYID